MSENQLDLFDKDISLDEKYKGDEDTLLELVVSKEMELEDKRQELLYLRNEANIYNKRACIVGFGGIIIFLIIAFSGILNFDSVTLSKMIGGITGIIMGVLLIISMFFTFNFTLGYLRLKKSMGVTVSGVFLFCVLPLMSVFILVAIPAWNSLITKKLNKIFLQGGLEPVLVNEDNI